MATKQRGPCQQLTKENNAKKGEAIETKKINNDCYAQKLKVNFSSPSLAIMCHGTLK